MTWILWALAFVGTFFIVRFIMRTGRKSVAAVVVQNALEHAAVTLQTPLHAAPLANAIVAGFCDVRPELFSSSQASTIRPTIIALGAVAQARLSALDKDFSNVLQTALGQIVLKAGRDGLDRSKPYNGEESEILLSSYAIYQDTSLD